MPSLPLPPVDDTTTIAELTRSPYPIYERFRKESPVVRVQSVGRILLTKAEECRAVKLDAELFSSDDPGTPMERAFQAKTLMRRDGDDHMRLRLAMNAGFNRKTINDVLIPAYETIADEFLDTLPTGTPVDLFTTLAGPLSARCLAFALGIEDASDDDMQRWSQALINGAGNFGWADEPFRVADKANDEINAVINASAQRYRVEPNTSALSVMVNAEQPIEMEHIISNIKIAIGGGINEPRDALLTALFGLLVHPEQQAAVVAGKVACSAVVEEAVRWVAPIQVSSRRATRDTSIRGYRINEGDVVMTVQASANRDEDVIENGHIFDVFREKNTHQSFGVGPHFCMGSHIARRMIGDVLLPKLFARFPSMRLTHPDDVVWSGFGFRGPLNLPVILQ